MVHLMARNNKPQPIVPKNLSVEYFRGIADQQTIDFDKKGRIKGGYTPDGRFEPD